MKDGKYFTGNIAFSGIPPDDHSAVSIDSAEYLDFIAWSRHPDTAKVWEKHRSWAERAAAKWGGEVVEILGTTH